MALPAAIAQTHLDEWLAADLAVAKNQAYQIAGRTITRADAKEIRENIDYWQNQLSRARRSGIRIRSITPVG
ncbi:MAG: hypothetical protein HQL56_01135 [Magnetococcales bacterium]|nr:hypothetical protein [Magnetococcales bacterium]